MINRIKIMGAFPDDRELYYYSYPTGYVSYNVVREEYIPINDESALKTNTIRIFELSNALEQYEKIMSRMKILVILLGKNKRVKEEYQSLKDEIRKLEETSRYIDKRIKEYDDNMGGYIYLDKGYKEAINRFVRVLKPKKNN